MRRKLAMIEQALEEVATAEAGKARSERDHQRYTLLAATDFASRQRLETAEADDRKAAAALLKKRAALAAAHDQLNVLRAKRDEEKNRRTQARANLQLAKNELDNTTIRTPSAGDAA